MTDLEQAYNERLKELEAENAKLREIIREMNYLKARISDWRKRLHEANS